MKSRRSRPRSNRQFQFDGAGGGVGGGVLPLPSARCGARSLRLALAQAAGLDVAWASRPCCGEAGRRPAPNPPARWPCHLEPPDHTSCYTPRTGFGPPWRCRTRPAGGRERRIVCGPCWRQGNRRRVRGRSADAFQSVVAALIAVVPGGAFSSVFGFGLAPDFASAHLWWTDTKKPGAQPGL